MSNGQRPCHREIHKVCPVQIKVNVQLYLHLLPCRSFEEELSRFQLAFSALSYQLDPANEESVVLASQMQGPVAAATSQTQRYCLFKNWKLPIQLALPGNFGRGPFKGK